MRWEKGEGERNNLTAGPKLVHLLGGGEGGSVLDYLGKRVSIPPAERSASLAQGERRKRPENRTMTGIIRGNQSVGSEGMAWAPEKKDRGKVARAPGNRRSRTTSTLEKKPC